VSVCPGRPRARFGGTRCRWLRSWRPNGREVRRAAGCLLGIRPELVRGRRPSREPCGGRVVGWAHAGLRAC
jgi:hypothetical protein